MITIEDLINKLTTFNEEELNVIKKAYYYADASHKNQYRESGEEYISHPLNVAYILAEIYADVETICAGLLHDTLEDTKTSKKDIEEAFSKEIADLVSGVTNIKRMSYSTLEENKLANTRKIITSITKDVRIIIIKLADRLHNMRTLEYKDEFKQKETALETIEIYAPIAYYIGAYRIKSELEDLCLQYLKPDIYKKIEEERNQINTTSISTLEEMLLKINDILNNEDIPHKIKMRTKNIYGIYKKLNEGYGLNEIHDLHSLKIMVDTISKCYLTLGLIHSKYIPINEKFKDYIANPKTNMYRSLHSTVFGANDKLVQTQIRTFEMDKVDSFGLTAYWDLNRNSSRTKMQEELQEKYQFYESLTEIDDMFGNNELFTNQIKEELFGHMVYVYTTKGAIIELPLGSTIIDFAFKVMLDKVHQIEETFINGEAKPLDYVLKNKDRVKINIDNLVNDDVIEWEDKVKTTYAKRKILEYKKEDTK